MEPGTSCFPPLALLLLVVALREGEGPMLELGSLGPNEYMVPEGPTFSLDSSRAATGLQQGCNRAATGLQQGCNRAATGLQQGSKAKLHRLTTPRDLTGTGEVGVATQLQKAADRLCFRCPSAAGEESLLLLATP